MGGETEALSLMQESTAAKADSNRVQLKCTQLTAKHDAQQRPRGRRDSEEWDRVSGWTPQRVIQDPLLPAPHPRQEGRGGVSTVPALSSGLMQAGPGRGWEICSAPQACWFSSLLEIQ